jgi:hypothetical protein
VTPRTIRRLVLVVFVGGIGGMILGSILDNNGVAITFGLVTATAAVGLILVTAVAPPGSLRRPAGDRSSGSDSASDSSLDANRSSGPDPDTDVDAAGALIEEQVDLLVAAGADERELRELVRRSIAFGRRAS